MATGFITLKLDKAEHNAWKAAAKAQSNTLNGFIRYCVRKEIGTLEAPQDGKKKPLEAIPAAAELEAL